MDGDDPVADAPMSAFSTIVKVSPPGKVVPTLRPALAALLVEEAIPATIGERPRPSRRRATEAQPPACDRGPAAGVRPVSAAASRSGYRCAIGCLPSSPPGGTSRRELARQLGIAPSESGGG
jgi:hypothetical protein